MRFLTLLILFGIIVLETGCQKSMLSVQSVTGTVTYQGNPVDEAVITFVARSTDKHGAAAITTSKGTYAMVTPGVKTSGVEIGDYDVFITKSISVDKAGNPIPKGTGMETVIEGSAQATEYPAEKSLIPIKYNNPDKPLLNVTVKKGKNIFDFNLED
ncbi:MAG: hypothetical protein LBI18_16050 [Planctomycetaceae bacterium]|jgi:hypothetical protein|nr:hypothetical protein [Planctomycetaceae bacterium]